MYIYSVIPARGGSKGIVDKNLRLIGGVPLVGRSVIASTGSSKITETFVSSDSEAILEIGSIYGASSLKRPTKFAMDKSSTDEVLMHFVSYLEVNKKEPDIIVFLQCTSPFTSSKDVNRVLDTLINNPDIDCAFSANIDHSFLWFKKDKNKAVGLNHSAYKPRKRRQDLEDIYKENGAIYAIRTSALKKTRNRFGRKAIPVVTDTNIPFEIDDLIELEIAQSAAHLFKDPSNNLYSKCQALIMDFDGVHTDDKAYLTEANIESVRISRSDGMGIGILKNKNIKLLILTSEKNNVVVNRAKKLNIDIEHGCKDKLTFLKNWAKDNNINKKYLAYVGNDINDLNCMNWVGMPFAPQDAHPHIRNSGARILKTFGGNGVIREVADLLKEKI